MCSCSLWRYACMVWEFFLQTVFTLLCFTHQITLDQTQDQKHRGKHNSQVPETCLHMRRSLFCQQKTHEGKKDCKHAVKEEQSVYDTQKICPSALFKKCFIVPIHRHTNPIKCCAGIPGFDWLCVIFSFQITF